MRTDRAPLPAAVGFVEASEVDSESEAFVGACSAAGEVVSLVAGAASVVAEIVCAIAGVAGAALAAAETLYAFAAFFHLPKHSRQLVILLDEFRQLLKRRPRAWAVFVDGEGARG